ncbi:uncharacterized protein LOC143851032 isoform X2 [Tasmannia lanceolata]|uniref:uncharacterized protein LOC143851032 isoform X2 n=1 Tax=Tasmannia lanceolata TaxID=3420 RepID=UPI00406355E0
MADAPRTQKMIHAIRRAPDQGAFKKWESFTKFSKSEDHIKIDRIGFQTWKNMSTKERYPYKIQAEKVNLAYLKVVLEEIDNISKVDDEADSAMLGKFDPDYGDCMGWAPCNKSFERLESYEPDLLDLRIA